jgi:hypothetical protein
MSHIFERQEFKDLYDDYSLPWPFRKTPRIFEDLEFRGCTFIGCSLSLTHDPRSRSIVRRVQLLNCHERGCKLHPALVEEVMIDGLTTRHFHSWGAVFHHVTLKGRIGPIMLSHLVTPAQPHSTTQHAFTAANAAYYTDVDWALDIREAEFEDVDLRGVPGHLIRRDPETQVLVTRAHVLEGKWHQLRLEKTYWATALEFFLETNLASGVLIAPKRIKTSRVSPWKYQDLVDGLRLLQDEGVAEPD